MYYIEQDLKKIQKCHNGKNKAQNKMFEGIKKEVIFS